MLPERFDTAAGLTQRTALESSYAMVDGVTASGVQLRVSYGQARHNRQEYYLVTRSPDCSDNELIESQLVPARSATRETGKKGQISLNIASRLGQIIIPEGAAIGGFAVFDEEVVQPRS